MYYYLRKNIESVSLQLFEIQLKLIIIRNIVFGFVEFNKNNYVIL